MSGGFYLWLHLPYRQFPLKGDAQAGAVHPTVVDLPYADQSDFQKLDLYLPQSKAPAPLIIWFHGGGFAVGDKISMQRQDHSPRPKNPGRHGPYQIQVPDVAALTAKGYAVASVNYRLGLIMLTDAHAALADGKAAVRFLRANAAAYGIDPDRFAVWGNSAGGYMAAILGVSGDQNTVFDDASSRYAKTSPAVQAVIVWFGAEDRLPIEELSIAHYLPGAKSLPPFMIANGDADPIISPEQARRLQNALAKAGAKSSLTILPGAGHEDPQYMLTQMQPSFDFLDRALAR